MSRGNKLVSAAALAALGLLAGCGRAESPGALPGASPAAASPTATSPSPDGTRAMAERLVRIAAEADPMDNKFLNAGRAEHFRRVAAATGDLANRAEAINSMAEELNNAGRSEDAIIALAPLLDPGSEYAKAISRRELRRAREIRALAWLRVGEQANCVAHHGSESCLFPIQGGGIHSDTRGSRNSIADYLLLLEDNPQDLGSRWLMNIAFMTLGEWPDKVPPKFRIPLSTFASEADTPRFREAAIPARLITSGIAGGAAMADFDGDGDLDILFTHMGVAEPPDYFRNEGDGTFSERTREAGIETLTGGLNFIHADYDNDGDVDVFVARGGWMQLGGRYPNSLLRNRGDGTFEDVTEWAGLLTFHPTQAVAFADYDNDGWLDLFVGNESTPEDPHPSELWHNEGNGRFRDAASELGEPDLGYVKGAAWGDIDNDGHADLYLSTYNGPNRLLRNRGSDPGQPRFVDVTDRAGVAEPRMSFPTWWFDYDNDGWLDILAAGYSTHGVGDIAALALGLPSTAATPRLYRNQRDGSFREVAKEMRLDRVALPMGSNWGDMDEDGWPDIYFGTGDPTLASLMPNRLLRNDRGRQFQDVTTAAGVGHLQKGHGVSLGDIDGDGDLDLLEEMGGGFEGDVAFSVLYENPGHGQRWIVLRLEGRRSNRSAFGVRVRATVRTPEGSRDIHTLAGAGGSFGDNSLQTELGLGAASALEQLEVWWPASGERQTFRDVAMDRYYRLVEGQSLEAIEPVRFRLAGAPPAPTANPR